MKLPMAARVPKEFMSAVRSIYDERENEPMKNFTCRVAGMSGQIEFKCIDAVDAARMYGEFRRALFDNGTRYKVHVIDDSGIKSIFWVEMRISYEATPVMNQPCKQCDAEEGVTEERGFHRCNACGYPGS